MAARRLRRMGNFVARGCHDARDCRGVVSDGAIRLEEHQQDVVAIESAEPAARQSQPGQVALRVGGRRRRREAHLLPIRRRDRKRKEVSESQIEHVADDVSAYDGVRRAASRPDTVVRAKTGYAC